MHTLKSILLSLLLLAAAMPAHAQLVYDKNAPLEEAPPLPSVGTETVAPTAAPTVQQPAKPAPAAAAAAPTTVMDATVQSEGIPASVKTCLENAKKAWEAGIGNREADRYLLEEKLRNVCATRQYDAVKIAINEFLYSEFLRPRFDGIQACLVANGESLPEKLDPKGKEIIADGMKYCQMLMATKTP